MGKCKICDLPAIGNHFGVQSCRACAAFFRRGALRKVAYKCKNNPGENGKCEIYNKKSESYACKKCRMEKCQRLGMDVKRFQFNRDSFIAPGTLELSRIPSVTEAGPSFIYTSNHPSGITYIDLRHLLTRAESIFLRKNSHPPSNFSTLLKLSKAFSSVQTLPNAHGSRIYTKFGFPDKLKDWETSFLTVARWLTHFDQFQQLPIEFRMKMLSGIWNLWILFDKLSMNFLARKRGIVKENVFLVGENTYVDPENVSLDLEWMTNYKVDNLSYYLETIDWHMLSFIQPLMNLNPTNVELTFMISQLCLNYAGQRFQTPFLEISEKFQEILGNDLHDYYVNDQKLLRYSGRLAQLMKFVRSVEANIREKRLKVEVGNTFDVWKLRFSHPDVFEDNFC